MRRAGRLRRLLDLRLLDLRLLDLKLRVQSLPLIELFCGLQRHDGLAGPVARRYR